MVLDELKTKIYLKQFQKGADSSKASNSSYVHGFGCAVEPEGLHEPWRSGGRLLPMYCTDA